MGDKVKISAISGCHSSFEKSTATVTDLPEPPACPLDSDCCGNGCTPCVLDIYQQELLLWEAECERLTSGTQHEASESEEENGLVLNPDEYRSFSIESITPETPNIVRVRCSLPKNKSLGLTKGQHIIVRSRTADGSSITRQYTPVSPIAVKGYFEILIKIYPEGRMSQLVKKWMVGDMLHARGPLGSFSYSSNKYACILMLCAGTGVAPMCQVTGAILDDESEETILRLVYACHSYPHLMARRELDEFSRYWNFSALYVLSQEVACPEYKYKYGERVLRGRVSKELVMRELGERIQGTLVLVCGTRSFDADMLAILKELKVPDANVHKF